MHLLNGIGRTALNASIVGRQDRTRLHYLLVARKCHVDERTRRLVGHEKVIGRLAGQMTSVIFVLLKEDEELLAHLAPGTTPPEPQLYDAELHRKHR